MNHMTVTTLWTTELPSAVSKESLQSTAHDIPSKSSETLDLPMRTVLRIGNLCNNGRLASTHMSAASTAPSVHSPTSPVLPHSRFVGQPTDVAMLDLLDAFGEEDVRSHTTRTGEVPFSSMRKWMGVVVEGSSGQETAYIKGALEKVLTKCDTYLTKDGRVAVLDEGKKIKAAAAAETMAEEGLRVLGFASGPVGKFDKRNNDKLEDSFKGLTFAGIVGMYDPPRQGVEKAIKRLMKGSVKVIMITGDAETTAIAIAKKLGIQVLPSMAIQTGLGIEGLDNDKDRPVIGHHSRSVIRGDELDNMTDEQLSHAISTTTIFARTSPEHKMKIIRALQSPPNDAVVAMTGDGVNDAPALKMADIGISMGVLGTDVAKEAADMILTDDDFGTILKAIEEGKGIFHNIQNFLTFQLSTSVAALSLVLVSTFWGLENPLNPMQILWISTYSFPSHDLTIYDYNCNHVEFLEFAETQS